MFGSLSDMNDQPSTTSPELTMVIKYRMRDGTLVNLADLTREQLAKDLKKVPNAMRRRFARYT
jgi:hypothetical protein